jgi:hypothetical protein
VLATVTGADGFVYRALVGAGPYGGSVLGEAPLPSADAGCWFCFRGVVRFSPPSRFRTFFQTGLRGGSSDPALSFAASWTAAP